VILPETASGAQEKAPNRSVGQEAISLQSVAELFDSDVMAPIDGAFALTTLVEDLFCILLETS
jgi:hypothetical protein